MDRMEIIPLLANRAVVFVESKRDRNLLQDFAQKHWGEKKQQAGLACTDVSLHVPESGRRRRAGSGPAGPGPLEQPRSSLQDEPSVCWRSVTGTIARTRRVAPCCDTHARQSEDGRVPSRFQAPDVGRQRDRELRAGPRTAMLSVLDRQADARGRSGRYGRSSGVRSWRNWTAFWTRQRENVRQSVATRIQQEDRKTRAEHGARPGRRVPGRASGSATRAVVRCESRPRAVSARGFSPADSACGSRSETSFGT